MKYIPSILSFLVLLPVTAVAQTEIPATPAVTLATAVHLDTPSVSLGLKSGEAIRTFGLAVQNDEDQPLKVFGAQTTSGLYVVDYPKEIAAKGQATVTLLYVANQNSTSTADLLRLMTNLGERVVQIDHGRQETVRYDTTMLQWQQGENPVTKFFIVTMLSDISVPKGAKALGVGNKATIEPLGDNRYRVDVSPGSTEKPQQFAVLIQFAPMLPDAPALIPCQVVARQ